MTTQSVTRLAISLVDAGMSVAGVAANLSLEQDSGKHSFHEHSSGQVFRIDWTNEPTQQEKQQAATIVAAFNLNETAVAAWETQQKRKQAKALLRADDADSIRLRSILRAVYASLAEVRGRNGLPNRTWNEVLSSIDADIDAGNCDV